MGVHQLQAAPSQLTHPPSPLEPTSQLTILVFISMPLSLLVDILIYPWGIQSDKATNPPPTPVVVGVVVPSLNLRQVAGALMRPRLSNPRRPLRRVWERSRFRAEDFVGSRLILQHPAFVLAIWAPTRTNEAVDERTNDSLRMNVVCHCLHAKKVKWKSELFCVNTFLWLLCCGCL